MGKVPAIHTPGCPKVLQNARVSASSMHQQWVAHTASLPFSLEHPSLIWGHIAVYMLLQGWCCTWVGTATQQHRLPGAAHQPDCTCSAAFICLPPHRSQPPHLWTDHSQPVLPSVHYLRRQHITGWPIPAGVQKAYTAPCAA